ncbi:hyaluronan synthase 1-like [Scyliorhinus canicula]|uniref:hyaluronan synthase 1-like n=1 Tax=Scyliorhinus canicula TaxID=7830 RepID=UPI0018F68EDE|nr:hyaluronan synthase 1-like [Scyliorhinus canicula]
MDNNGALLSMTHRTCNMVFALLLFLGMSWAYLAGFQLLLNGYKLISLGMYGSLVIIHLFLQTVFAMLECNTPEDNVLRCSSTKSVAIIIPAYQEDPLYLAQCLNSVKNIEYPSHKLRIIMVIDGNSKEDQYMMDMFKEVFCKEDIGTYVWKGNYHSRNFNRVIQNKEEDNNKRPCIDPVNLFYGEACIGNPERLEVESLISTKRCVCIMQKRGGKREGMYTAFKAIGDTVDYIQVCDSDTKLDSQATMELVKVLDSKENYGAVGGEVRVLNVTDSFISVISSLRYWITFNIERACQSYFDCVSCISGPLGMYRNTLLQQLLEPWYNQRFLGTRCTMGDDRHLTNRVLSLGYSTKYTPKAWCYTETPAQYLRWLNQQIRWTKSSFIEWFYSPLWWHKQSLWITYESVVMGILPVFIGVTIVKIFYHGYLLDILWVLLCFHGIALLKAFHAACLNGGLVMILVSLYPVIYLSGLLPIKCFSLLTINNTNWGTSGRKERVKNYIPLLPLLVWGIILLVGFIETIFLEIEASWIHTKQPSYKNYVLYGALALFSYWASMAAIYQLWSWHRCKRNTAMYLVEV